MNLTHIDDLLFAGDPDSLRRAAEHAAECAACAGELASWNELSTTARALRHEWPSDTLLPRIQRSIAAERRPHRVWWQLAAALLLTIALGALVWRGWTLEQRRNAFDRTILQTSAVEEVERTELAHREAIDRLERQVAPVLQQPSSPLLVNYKEKLLLLDDAIAQCESAIRLNRQNAHLRKQLLSIYSEKQRTLEELVREEKHVTSE